MKNEELLKPKDAAAALSVSINTLRNYYRMGRIQTVMLGSRHRIARSELEWVMKYGLRSTTPEARAKMRRKKAITRSNRRAEAAARAAAEQGGQA